MNRDELKTVLLHLIKSEMSISQISSILNISYQEIYKLIKVLRDNGFAIDVKYYSNGNMRYYYNKKVYSENTPAIITSPNETEISLLAYADLHIGSHYDSRELLVKLFEYGAKENIHIHLNVGDLLEGNVRQDNIKTPWYLQVEKALNFYPHQDDVITFLLLGNHDQSLLRDFGLNVNNAINSRRNDIVPIGYGNNIIEIKNDFIVLQHRLLKQSDSGMGSYNYALILRGHHHMTSVTVDTSNLVIYLPSLSYLNFNDSHFPGAISFRLKMRNGLIEYVEFDNLIYIDKQFHITNTSSIYVGKGKLFRENNTMKNEEECPKILRRSL